MSNNKMGHTCSFPKLRTKLWEKKSEANIWYESDFILCQSSAHNCFMARFIKPLAVGSTFVICQGDSYWNHLNKKRYQQSTGQLLCLVRYMVPMAACTRGQFKPPSQSSAENLNLCLQLK